MPMVSAMEVITYFLKKMYSSLLYQNENIDSFAHQFLLLFVIP